MMKRGNNFSLYDAEEDDVSFVMLDAVFNISAKKFISLFHTVDRISEWCKMTKVAVQLEQLEKAAKAEYFTLKMPYTFSDRELFVLSTAVNRLENDSSILLLAIPFAEV